MIPIIIIAVVACAVLGYMLYKHNQEIEKLKLSLLKYRKIFDDLKDDLKLKEYDGYDDYYDDKPYGIDEYNIKPYVELDDKKYDITNTEYFKNKVELLETKKRFKALLASSNIQKHFLNQFVQYMESEDTTKFNKMLGKLAKNLGVSEDEARDLYSAVTRNHPFYYDYNTNSRYAREREMDEINSEDWEIIRKEILDNPDAEIDSSLKNIYNDFMLYLPHGEQCSYTRVCDIDVNQTENCHKLRKKFDLFYDPDDTIYFGDSGILLQPLSKFDWDKIIDTLIEKFGKRRYRIINEDLRKVKHTYKNNTLEIYPSNEFEDHVFSQGSTAELISVMLGSKRRLKVHHFHNKGKK